MQNLNVLVLSHFIEGNRVFEDYCKGIKSHSKNYYFVDYIDQYASIGKHKFEKKIEDLIIEKNIDCVFFIWWSCDLTFELKFIEKLSSLAKLVVNYFDTEYFFEGVDRYYAQLADLVLLPDCLSRYKYQQLNIPVMSTFALYDKGFYCKDRSIRKDIDVSFVGNLKQADRKAYIDFLIANGISVTSYGVGSANGFVSNQEMVGVFNRSKINLNFTMTSDRSNYVINPPAISQRIRQSKGRPNEIALSGGFILSEYAPGIEEMYSIGEEMDVFRTKEELLEKIRHYLLHDDERTAMAENSYNHALKSYDAVSGFANVFQTLEKIGRTRNKTAIVDREFLENFSAYRFYYISLFLLNGRLKNIPAELALIWKTKKLNLKKCFHFAIKGFLVHMRGRPMENKLKLLKNRLGIQLKN